MNKWIAILSGTLLIVVMLGGVMVLANGNPTLIPTTVSILPDPLGEGRGGFSERSNVPPSANVTPPTPVAPDYSILLYQDASGLPLSSIQWGTLSKGQTTQKQVYIRNTGNQPLIPVVSTDNLSARLSVRLMGPEGLAISQSAPYTLIANTANMSSGNYTLNTMFQGMAVAVPPYTTVISDGKYNQTPDLITLPDGSLYCVYRAGLTDGQDKGWIAAKRSLDGGGTWSTPQTVYADNVSDIQTPNISRLANGALVISYWLNDYKREVPLLDGGRVITSRDNGTSWSAPVVIDSQFTGASYTGGRVLQKSNGQLVMLMSGMNQGDQFYSASVIISDNGSAWGNEVVIANGEVLKRNFHEPTGAVSGDNITVLMRSNTTIPWMAYRSTSMNSGISWSSPQPAYVGDGRPSLLRLTDGRLLATYRRYIRPEWQLQFPAYRLSSDGGVTWSDERYIDFTGTYTVYASAIEIAPGSIAVVYGQVTESNAVCSIRFRRLEV